MTDYHIRKIIRMVKDNMNMDEEELMEKINEMMHDDWVALTGFGDE